VATYSPSKNCLLFLDGVYVIGEEGLVFRRVRPPTRRSLEHLVQTIGQRVGTYLERQGLLVRDMENTYLALESTEASAMDDLLGHSISYRIAVGPQTGRKAFTLHTSPDYREPTGKRTFKRQVFCVPNGRSWPY